MHGKEQVLAPLLEPVLGFHLVVPDRFDTDQFGTFTGEVERPAPQLATARLKAQAVLAATGGDLALASEGAFGPHPELPLVPANVEMLLLLDVRQGWEVTAQYLTPDTNFAQQTVTDWPQAEAFAQRAGFPSHGLIARPLPSGQVVKGITETAALQQILANFWATGPASVQLETDMRAMHNPTRQRAIAEAAGHLLARLASRCPRCGTPGFGPGQPLPGLPCGWCGLPTRLPLAHVRTCARCGYSDQVAAAQPTADPAYCEFCNP
jgi:hypothetical protein